jgi:hypothetical protein
LPSDLPRAKLTQAYRIVPLERRPRSAKRGRLVREGVAVDADDMDYSARHQAPACLFRCPSGGLHPRAGIEAELLAAVLTQIPAPERQGGSSVALSWTISATIRRSSMR